MSDGEWLYGDDAPLDHDVADDLNAKNSGGGLQGSNGVTCKYCMQSGLTWRNEKGRWRLYEKDYENGGYYNGLLRKHICLQQSTTR